MRPQSGLSPTCRGWHRTTVSPGNRDLRNVGGERCGCGGQGGLRRRVVVTRTPSTPPGPTRPLTSTAVIALSCQPWAAAGRAHPEASRRTSRRQACLRGVDHRVLVSIRDAKTIRRARIDAVPTIGGPHLLPPANGADELPLRVARVASMADPTERGSDAGCTNDRSGSSKPNPRAQRPATHRPDPRPGQTVWSRPPVRIPGQIRDELRQLV